MSMFDVPKPKSYRKFGLNFKYNGNSAEGNPIPDAMNGNSRHETPMRDHSAKLMYGKPRNYDRPNVPHTQKGDNWGNNARTASKSR